jgi:hypothetical protein
MAEYHSSTVLPLIKKEIYRPIKYFLPVYVIFSCSMKSCGEEWRLIMKKHLNICCKTAENHRAGLIRV